jgi:S1-C subfamily serine protease
MCAGLGHAQLIGIKMDENKAQEYSEVIQGALKMGDAPGQMSHEALYKLATALGGMPYIGSFPGSPADKAGLKYGDVLLQINGVATADHVSYVKARGMRSDGCTYTVWRAGVETSGEMVF